MNITLVAAASENNVIGKNNQLLWRLPNDLKFFKNTTWAMPVIMGRKTFASVNYLPLPGRMNIIVSRTPEVVVNRDLVKVVTTLQAAISVAATCDVKEAFVIGGGEIYTAALPFANKIYLTRVRVNIEGDSFFPKFSENEWKLISNLDFPMDDKHIYAYSFQIWERSGENGD